MQETNASTKHITPEIRPAHKTPLDNELSGHCVTVSAAIANTRIIERIAKRREAYQIDGKVSLSGIATKLQAVDEVIDGLQPGHLIILAGRAGMGKTYTALNIIKNIAIDQEQPVALFSLEMSNAQVLYRLMSLCSGIPARTIKSGTSDSIQFEAIVQTASALERSPMFITEDACNSNLKNLVENIKKVHVDQSVKLIVIDHLGLVRRESRETGRANEVGEITRTLKLLAKELNLPILCLAQLNRQADTPEIPQLSHLRESGSIEQDADVVIFVHRRDYYDASDRPGELDIIVAKNRDGEGNRTISHTYSNESWLIKEKASIAIQVSESVRNIMNLFPDSELDIDDEAFRQALKPSPKKGNNYKK